MAKQQDQQFFQTESLDDVKDPLAKKRASKKLLAALKNSPEVEKSRRTSTKPVEQSSGDSEEEVPVLVTTKISKFKIVVNLSDELAISKTEERSQKTFKCKKRSQIIIESRKACEHAKEEQMKCKLDCDPDSDSDNENNPKYSIPEWVLKPR